VLSIARRSGVKVVMGVTEGLPLRDRTFDIVTFVKTLCFVDDPLMALVEARMALREHGRVIIGFIDRGSRIGHGYRGG
jgi:SAM-dependent methyltransferase